MGHLRLTVVTICHLKASIGHLMATKGHLMATISQLRATIDHFRVTIGYLRATIGHMLVNIGHLTVSFLFFFQANLRQNATELHHKVRPTCCRLERPAACSINIAITTEGNVFFILFFRSIIRWTAMVHTKILVFLHLRCLTGLMNFSRMKSLASMLSQNPPQ